MCVYVCVSIPVFSQMTYVGSFTYYYLSTGYEELQTHTHSHTQKGGLAWCDVPVRCQAADGMKQRGVGHVCFLFFSHTSTYTHRHTPVLPLRCPVTKRVVSRSVGSLNCLTSARKLPKHACTYPPPPHFRTTEHLPMINIQIQSSLTGPCCHTHTPQEK